MLHGMNMLIKAGRSRFISLHFPGKVTPHPSAGSRSQMEFAVVAAPSRRDYQAAFPGQTADLGALLTRAATQQETDKREHWDAYSHKNGIYRFAVCQRSSRRFVAPVLFSAPTVEVLLCWLCSPPSSFVVCE